MKRAHNGEVIEEVSVLYPLMLSHGLIERLCSVYLSTVTPSGAQGVEYGLSMFTIGKERRTLPKAVECS